jgi:hypothetical protein
MTYKMDAGAQPVFGVPFHRVSHAEWSAFDFLAIDLAALSK